jgi:hypothetical protein
MLWPPTKEAAMLHPTQQNHPRRIVAIRPPARGYSRAADLVRLLPLWPEELADHSLVGRARLVVMLERALRLERQRGIGGHWAYDLSRHAHLMEALRCERAELAALQSASPGKRRRSPAAPSASQATVQLAGSARRRPTIQLSTRGAARADVVDLP